MLQQGAQTRDAAVILNLWFGKPSLCTAKSTADEYYICPSVPLKKMQQVTMGTYVMTRVARIADEMKKYTSSPSTTPFKPRTKLPVDPFGT